MASYYIVMSLHILGATIWAGGHLVLALTILPDALTRCRHLSATATSRVAATGRPGMVGER